MAVASSHHPSLVVTNAMLMVGRRQEDTEQTPLDSDRTFDEGICIVTQPERTGTGKAHVEDLADILTQLTSTVILTANLPADAPLREAQEVVTYSDQGTGESLPREVLRFIRNQIRLCAAIRQRPEEIILFFGATAYLLPVVFARLIGKRVVILPRGDVPRSLRLRWDRHLPTVVAQFLAGLVALLERINYRVADAIITYTPSMATQLGLDRYQSKLFTDGARYVDTDRFDIRVPLADRRRTIGYVGRFDVEKRLPLLVEVAKILSDEFEFIFVGDGDYRGTLEAELAAEIERGDVTVTGWVDRGELPAYYNELRLLVVPSEPTEGLPTVALEAMACGTPVYATPVAGVPDLVTPEVTGYFMETDDPLQEAAELRRIMAEGNLEQISVDARERIETAYSFEQAVRRYHEILTNM